MKLTIESRDLKEALQGLSATPSTRAMPTSSIILSADQFGGLTLKRNTLEATMRVECKSVVHEDGEIAVTFDRLAATAARWGVVTVELFTDVPGKKLNFKAGSATGSLAIIPKNEVEKDILPLIGPTASIGRNFDAQTFRDAMKSTLPAIYDGPGRDSLRGICLRSIDGKLVLLGNDGRRFHAVFMGEGSEPVNPDPERSFDPGLMLEKKVALAVDRLIGDRGGTLTLKVGANGGTAEIGGRYLRFLTPAECPPDTSFLLRTLSADLTVKAERSRLLDLVKAASGLSAMNSAITVRMAGGFVAAEVGDGTGHAWRDEVVGSSTRDCAFRVNGGYFADLLEAAKGEEVEFIYNKEYHAVSLREADRLCIVSLLRDATEIMP